MIASELPWVNINFTLHGVLHHSAELIHSNKGWSIGSLSEEPLERNNNFVRRCMQQYVRTSSPVLQLTDAMSRLLERSYLEVLNFQKQFHNRFICETCSGRNNTKNHQCFSGEKSMCLDMFDSSVPAYIL